MLDETRTQLHLSKNQHLRQIELMESEELIAQKKVRCELMQLEDVLAQLRREYDDLRTEFEQNIAANEQTAPINREMRHLITSLQNHNGQLKGEVQRYKRKYKDASTDNVKLRRDIEELTAKIENLNNIKMQQQQQLLQQQQQQQQSPQAQQQQNTSNNGNDDINMEFVGSTKDDTLNRTCSTTSLSSDITNSKEEGHIKAEDDTTTDDDSSKELKETDVKKEASLSMGNTTADRREPTAAIGNLVSCPSSTITTSASQQQNIFLKPEKDMKDNVKGRDIKPMDNEAIRDLKAQLKYVLFLRNEVIKVLL